MQDSSVQSPAGSDSAGLPPVSVVIPAYDEENAIGREVETIHRVLTTHRIEHEILVVDDGSSDRTAELAAAAGARVLQHVGNRGYGASLKDGINAARHEIIAITDADGTYPAERLPELLAELRTADMVVGARTGSNVRIPLVRRPAKFTLNVLANLIAGRKIPDLNSGFRVFRRDTARQYLAILSNQFSFTTTITLAFLADEYRVSYVPIDYHTRIGRSKIRPRHFMEFMILVLRMAMLFQPLRVFLPLAMIFGAVGAAKAISDLYFFFQRTPSPGISLLDQPVLSSSSMLMLLTGLQLLVVGLVADGVIRRIAQQAVAQVPSRAIRTLGEDDDPQGISHVRQGGARE
jgi:glycosyltransferase involved in cell wall biosynthesis